MNRHQMRHGGAGGATSASPFSFLKVLSASSGEGIRICMAMTLLSALFSRHGPCVRTHLAAEQPLARK